MFNQPISPMYSFISVSPKNNTPQKRETTSQQNAKMLQSWAPKNPTKKTLVQHVAHLNGQIRYPFIPFTNFWDQKKTYAQNPPKSPIQTARCHPVSPRYFHHPTILPKLKGSEDQHRRVGSLKIDLDWTPAVGSRTDPCLVLKSWDMFFYSLKAT